MKKLLLVAGLLVLAAPAADACGFAFGGSSSTPAEPAPVEPMTDHSATKLVGGLLVASVLVRWGATGVKHMRTVYA